MPPPSPSLRPLKSTPLNPRLAAHCAGPRSDGRERTGSSVELAVTVLVGGREGSNELDVYLHLGFYVLQVYGTVGAHLVVVGPGRGGKAEVFRLGKERKDLEKMRIGRPLRGVSYCQTMGITFLKAMPGISSLCVERMSVDMKCRRHCK